MLHRSLREEEGLVPLCLSLGRVRVAHRQILQLLAGPHRVLRSNVRQERQEFPAAKTTDVY